jgi:WD40 repeat protein
VRIFDTASGKELRHWAATKYGAHLLLFARDGKELLSWGHDADFWDIASGKRLGSIPAELAFAEPAVYSPNGQSLAFRSGNSHVVVWDVATRKQVWRCGEEPGLVELSGLALLASRFGASGDELLVNWDDDYASLILIRDGEPEFKALKKKTADLSKADIAKAIAAHPILLQRPIVVAGNRAAIGRPPEAVLPLLK